MTKEELEKQIRDIYFEIKECKKYLYRDIEVLSSKVDKFGKAVFSKQQRIMKLIEQYKEENND